MVLAMLIIGVGAGVLGAGFALIAGAGILTAVSIYAGAGMIALLFTALIVALRPDQPSPAHPGIVIAAE